MPSIDWSDQMEKAVGEIILAISLLLGSGYSIKYLHDTARKMAIEVITKKQPSLSAYTQKLIGKK